MSYKVIAQQYGAKLVNIFFHFLRLKLTRFGIIELGSVESRSIELVQWKFKRN